MCLMDANRSLKALRGHGWTFAELLAARWEVWNLCSFSPALSLALSFLAPPRAGLALGFPTVAAACRRKQVRKQKQALA